MATAAVPGQLQPLGVVTNVHSRQNRRGAYNAERLQGILGDRGLVAECRRVDDLEHILDDFLSRGVRTIGVNGGDGSWGVLLDRLHGSLPPERWPVLLPLRGGTMNMLANAVGLRGNPASILARLVERLDGNGSPPRLLLQKTLRVTASNTGRPRLGFVWANGMAYSFLREYYARAPASPLNALWTTTTLIAGGPLPLERFRRAWRTVPARVSVDGRQVLDGRLRIAVAAVVSKLVLWFAPFGQGVGGPTDGFGFMLNSMSMLEVLLRLWALSRGGYQGERHFSRPAQRVVVSSAGGYLIDGEPVQPAGEVEVVLERGPLIRLLIV